MYPLNRYESRKMYYENQVIRDPKKIEKHCITGRRHFTMLA